jgi:hypothetical protein
MNEPMTSQKRRSVGVARGKPSQQTLTSDLSGMTSVVVTTQDIQHHELTDENAVAVSGIPGKYFLDSFKCTFT